jgi:hypothetical protein
VLSTPRTIVPEIVPKNSVTRTCSPTPGPTPVAMTERIEKLVLEGRSTPGEKQRNDVDVKILKPAKK